MALLQRTKMTSCIRNIHWGHMDHFPTQAWKIKKIFYQKFLNFSEKYFSWGLGNGTLRTWKLNKNLPWKRYLCFIKKRFSDILGNWTFKWQAQKISGENFPSWKKHHALKKFLIFWEMELSCPKLEKLLYFFQKGLKSCKIISWPLIFFYYIVSVFPNVHRFNKKFFFFDDKIHTFSFLKIYAICYLSWKEYV